MLTMSLKEISDMLKKNFMHLGLDKKETKELQAGLNGFIKAVSFTIYFRCSSFLIPTKLSLLTLEFK